MRSQEHLPPSPLAVAVAPTPGQPCLRVRERRDLPTLPSLRQFTGWCQERHLSSGSGSLGAATCPSGRTRSSAGGYSAAPHDTAAGHGPARRGHRPLRQASCPLRCPAGVRPRRSAGPTTVVIEVSWLLEERPDIEAAFLPSVATGDFGMSPSPPPTWRAWLSCASLRRPATGSSRRLCEPVRLPDAMDLALGGSGRSCGSDRSA
jgi:hypothetical protein